MKLQIFELILCRIIEPDVSEHIYYGSSYLGYGYTAAAIVELCGMCVCVGVCVCVCVCRCVCVIGHMPGQTV